MVASSNNTVDLKNEELVLYITSKLKGCANYGAIMLAKALYYIDSIHYVKYGKPISSFPYVRQENGPTPAPAVFMPLKNKMIKDGMVTEEEIDNFGRIRRFLVAKKAYTVNAFSAQEIELMNQVIDDCREDTAINLIDKSHGLAWQLSKPFEELPLYTYLLTKSEVEEDDIIWANDELARLRP